MLVGIAIDQGKLRLDDRMVSFFPGTRFEYCSPGMHVLSAILQEATGMTTAEFARIHLFEPLGITDFIWEADPQGYSDGWAGLYLHPRDLAKIGYLVLHQGQWDGKQIISSRWVQEATKKQSKTGQGDNYGYGWWVPPPTQFIEFAAEGRGGQYIRVLPELNMIIVTTGGGFEWNDIVPMLVPSMVDTAEPLPANPTGVQQLNGALTAVLQPPSLQAPAPLSETAHIISGKTYAFPFSPLDLKTIRWEFDDYQEAHLFTTFYNQPDQDLLVGLDGVYRFYPIGEHDLPLGMRGSWLHPQTFLFEYDATPNGEGYTLQLRFDGDRVILNSKERTHEATLTIEGRIQQP